MITFAYRPTMPEPGVYFYDGHTVIGAVTSAEDAWELLSHMAIRRADDMVKINGHDVPNLPALSLQLSRFLVGEP